MRGSEHSAVSFLDLLPVRVTFEAPEYLFLALLLVPLYLAAGRRTFSKGRPRVAAVARVLVLLAIVLAAAGLTVKLPADRLGVVFVLDRSASLPEEARGRALAFVNEASAVMSSTDRAAVVVVGDGAMVELEPTGSLELSAIESAVSPHQTDLAGGIRLAEALLPSDTTRRIILLSDGEETRGDAIGQAASAEGDVELWTVPFSGEHGDEVLLEGMTAPDQVSEGGTFELRVVARSQAPASGTLHLYRGDAHLGSLPVELTGGRADVFVLRQEADRPGLLRYRAVLETSVAADAVPQNNHAVATVAVEGRARVLYAEGESGAHEPLTALLRGEGFDVDVVGPGDIPATLGALQPYSAVLLSDVPAFAMTGRQMQVLERYVRDLGRGLAMFGGDDSFGLGGYYKTPVEEVLPVRMDIQDKRFFPTLSMVFAIDKSGSMGGTGRAEKLGMAKEAAIQSSGLLSDRDRLGVVSFDSAASWAVPITTLSDRGRVISRISRMRAGGGTDAYVALKEAYLALARETSAQRHVVLLSDGVTFGADFETMIKMGARRDVTLSTVAFGNDSDAASMDMWARWGGGRSYLVGRPEHIPRIFTREAMLATRSFLVEETFTPTLGTPAQMTQGLGVLPPLHGFVATEAKPRARVSMWANQEQGTPLLATSRVGLGRSLAWTSDVKTRWARDWVGTEPYSRLFAQSIRWLVAAGESSNVQADAELDRGVLTVTVDAFDAEGGFRNFLVGEVRLVAPDLSVRSVPLQQSAPGRYVARDSVAADGSHLAAVVLRDSEGNEVGRAAAEASQPYSPEYRAPGGGEALLAEVARVGRGRALRATDAGVVFTPPRDPRLVPHALWPPLVVLAALLWLFDAAVRRLAWPLFGSSGGRILAPASAPSALPATLRGSPAPAVRRSPRGAAPDPSLPPAFVETGPKEAAPAQVEAKPETASEKYVGGLLAARRRARSKTEKEADD